MTKLPGYHISIAQKTDPLKAVAIGRRDEHWSGAPLRTEIIDLHPSLGDALTTARMPADLGPYFSKWYKTHADELKQANIRLSTYLESNWSTLIATIESLTGNSPWPRYTIELALSSLYPSSFWGDTHTIDLHYQTTDFGRDLLHELIHLRTEDILSNEWFIEHDVIDRQRGIFMELLAEIVLSRSANPKAQAARSPYPFFANYADQIKSLAKEPDFPTLAIATAQVINESRE